MIIRVAFEIDRTFIFYVVEDMMNRNKRISKRAIFIACKSWVEHHGKRALIEPSFGYDDWIKDVSEEKVNDKINKYFPEIK